LNAGHRRKRAIYRLIDQLGVSPEEVGVRANVGDNMTFVEALGDQLRENNHERVPIHDEARAIALQYEDIQRRTGVAPNIKKLGTDLGFGETKVREALSFATLPPRIQAFVADGLLSYGVVRRLRPLHEAYARYCASRDHSGDVAQLAEDELVTFSNQLLNLKLSGRVDQQRAAMIQNKVKEIEGRAEYQDGLFLLEPEPAASRRAESSQGLARLAFSVISHQIRFHELSKESLDELAESLQAAREIAASRHAVLDVFESKAG